jgi:predicted O-methyltransferase YrrM
MQTSNPADSALLNPQVQNVLRRLHALADARDPQVSQQASQDPGWKTADAQHKATLLGEALLPVSPEAGTFLYATARAMGARRIVEFGTSFGVSTLYFAAALHDNGGGQLIGSELDAGKLAKARAHLAEAGLSQYVEIRPGDAMQTLRDVGGPVDLLFLDGWKDLYLDVLHLTASALRPGAVVMADDVALFPEALASYLAYVRDPAHGFASVLLSLGDGIEYSVKR